MNVVCDKRREWLSKYNQTPRRKAYVKQWEANNPEKVMLNRTRQRAKRKGIEFDLLLEDLVIPEVCPILGIPLKVNQGRSGFYDDSPSIDRIDCSKGYTKGNVRVISNRANLLKNNAEIWELERVLEDLKNARGV